jgi:16S rRNA (uracil1498-N3)-methyltransferase
VYVSGISAGPSELPREQAHYVGSVHRLGVGASFVAFDPELGIEADARILRAERGRIECDYAEPRSAARRSLGITLLQGAAKGDRLEQVVRAGTALGVARIVVVDCERSVATPSEMRRERLRTIALEAARQSGRGDLPELRGPVALEAALAELDANTHLRLCLSPTARAPLAERVRTWTPGQRSALLIGPEGGLTDAELSRARDFAFEEAALGPFTLRTELAAIAALACFAGTLASVDESQVE